MKGLNVSYAEGVKAGIDIKAPKGQECRGADEQENQGNKLLGSLRFFVGAAAGALTPRSSTAAAWSGWRNPSSEPGMEEEGVGVFAASGPPHQLVPVTDEGGKWWLHTNLPAPEAPATAQSEAPQASSPSSSQS